MAKNQDVPVSVKGKIWKTETYSLLCTFPTGDLIRPPQHPTVSSQHPSSTCDPPASSVSIPSRLPHWNISSTRAGKLCLDQIRHITGGQFAFLEWSKSDLTTHVYITSCDSFCVGKAATILARGYGLKNLITLQNKPISCSDLEPLMSPKSWRCSKNNSHKASL